MMTILTSSRWNTFLDRALLLMLGEDPHIASPCSTWESLIWAHLHISISFKYEASLKHIVSSRYPSWTCTSSWSTLHLFFSLLMMMSWRNIMTHSIFFFFKTFFTGDSGEYTPDTPATSGTTLTRPFFGSSLNITLVNTWSSLLYTSFHHETNIWSICIAYGQDLQIKLNANISP